MKAWRDRIASRATMVGVIGQGYVGLPLALVFHQAGFRVLGFDIDPVKVAALSRGESIIQHIGSERVATAIASGKYNVTADFDRLRECDAIFICVPTPLGAHREPDNSYIHDTARAIASRLRPGQMVVLESTTYPGTTEQEVLPILEQSGLSCPGDFLLAFLPRARGPRPQGLQHQDHSQAGGRREPGLHGGGRRVVRGLPRARHPSQPRARRGVGQAAGEHLPLGEHRFGERAEDDPRPHGHRRLGSCPRRRHQALLNSRMPRYVIEKLTLALNGDRKAINGSRVLVLGLAYKADVDDDRESPSYEILELLLEAGAQIDYCDPWFPKTHRTRKHDLGLRSVPCDAATFSQYDALVVSTAHDVFRKAELYRGTRLVVDTRNLMAPLFPDGGGPRVVKA